MSSSGQGLGKRWRIVDEWNGGTKRPVVVFVSEKLGDDGHYECVSWVHRNKPYSFSESVAQGLKTEETGLPYTEAWLTEELRKMLVSLVLNEGIRPMIAFSGVANLRFGHYVPILSDLIRLKYSRYNALKSAFAPQLMPDASFRAHYTDWSRTILSSATETASPYDGSLARRRYWKKAVDGRLVKISEDYEYLIPFGFDYADAFDKGSPCFMDDWARQARADAFADDARMEK